MDKDLLELPPVKESIRDLEEIEKRIRTEFKRLMYAPLLRELGVGPKLSNSDDPLADAILHGTVRHEDGAFRGKFTAQVVKQLRAIGAVWDGKEGIFRLPTSKLPRTVREVVALSESKFRAQLKRLDRLFQQILPEKIAESVRVADLFDMVIYKADHGVAKSLRAVTVAPRLTDKQRRKIAAEWQENMDLWIQDFAAEEISELRAKVKKAVFAGRRRDYLVKTIQRSYGVTARKARFLAKQETGLLLAKLKETRYTSAGLPEYKWGCVAGSALHPVRPSHKRLEGKIFRWDDPPITTEPNQPTRRNNPGCDYGCRCFAIPVVRFKRSS